MLIAAAEPERSGSALAWMFQSLGPLYGLLLPTTGFLVFIGACLVVALSKRPSVIAAYLVILPLPFLIGVFGTFHGFIDAFRVMAQSDSPKAADIAYGLSMGLFSSWVGMFVTFPSYFIIAFGLFFRTVTWRDKTWSRSSWDDAQERLGRDHDE